MMGMEGRMQRPRTARRSWASLALAISVSISVSTSHAATDCTAAQQTAAADVASCKAFAPECSDGCAPYSHLWSAGASVFAGTDGVAATGATRVLAAPALGSFAAWAGEARNAKWNNSMCAAGMKDCCLIVSESDVPVGGCVRVECGLYQAEWGLYKLHAVDLSLKPRLPSTLELP